LKFNFLIKIYSIKPFTCHKLKTTITQTISMGTDKKKEIKITPESDKGSNKPLIRFFSTTNWK